jgi:hypothetical protein
MQPILFAGDPHRNFTPILRACAGRAPGSLILIGDCDCDTPLPSVLRPVFDAGWQVLWIIGNRDTDTESAWRDLVLAHPAGNIGGRVITIGNLRIGGLGGVFKPRVWHPVEREVPAFQTRAEFAASLDPAELWCGGLPLWHRDTVFPEDFAALRRQRFDVLACHEAPSAHRHGFAVIDELARQGGARLIVHGHHHQSYSATLADGIRVRGLGLAEVWELPA